MIEITVNSPFRKGNEKVDNLIIIRREKLKPTDKFLIKGVSLTAQELAGVNAKYNCIRCDNCNTILQSFYYHHTIFCSCGNCKISGGGQALLRDCKGPFTELSTFYNNQNEKSNTI